MNYTKLLIFFSLFTYSFCSKSHPSQDSTSERDEEIVDLEEGKEDLILASFLYEKFKYTFDLANNPEYLKDNSDKPLTFSFLEIDEEDDWKLVAKIQGLFTYADAQTLEVHLDLMKYGIVGPDEEVTQDNKNDVIQLSTVEVSSVKSPFRVLLTCADCEDVLNAIGEANDGLHITEDVMTYDTIGANVVDNGDGSFTMSMVVLLYNDMDYSEITSMFDNDEAEQIDQSNTSEQDIDVDVSLKEFINSKFNQNLQAASKIEMNQTLITQSPTHKYLV